MTWLAYRELGPASAVSMLERVALLLVRLNNAHSSAGDSISPGDVMSWCLEGDALPESE